MLSIATPTHWKFSMSILKNNVLVSLLRAWMFGLWALLVMIENVKTAIGFCYPICNLADTLNIDLGKILK